MNRRKFIIAVAASFGMLILILDSRCAVTYGCQAIELCLKSVIPSLYPLIFLSGLLTSALWGSSNILLRQIAKILNIPSGGEYLLLSGFLSGYPVGALTISDAVRCKQINEKTAQALLAYCNNAGPAFLFGMVAPQFSEKWMSWSLWAIHVLSAAMVGNIFFRPEESEIEIIDKNLSLMDIIVNSIKSLAMICGWILLFRLFIGFLERWVLWLFPDSIKVLIIGLLELSNGCCRLTEIEAVSARFIAAAAMLSFGGVCVYLQTVSAVRGISLKTYISGKLLQTVFSIVLAISIVYGYGIIIFAFCGLLLTLPKIRKKEVDFCCQS